MSGVYNCFYETSCTPDPLTAHFKISETNKLTYQYNKEGKSWSKFYNVVDYQKSDVWSQFWGELPILAQNGQKMPKSEIRIPNFFGISLATYPKKMGFLAPKTKNKKKQKSVFMGCFRIFWPVFAQKQQKKIVV